MKFITKLLNQQKLFKVLFFIALALLTLVCLIPLSGPAFEINNIDKLYHFSAYLILAFVFERGFVHLFKYGGVLMLIGYGILVEFAQGQTEFRTMSIADIVANSAGVIFYLVIVLTIQRLVSKREQ